jgi:hypothetical protein
LYLTGAFAPANTPTFTDVTFTFPVDLKVFLQGPYSAGTMSTALQAGAFIPLSQPYSGAPWNYAGTENVASVPAGVVDWILLEIRTADVGPSVASKAVFLMSDGSLMDVDGSLWANLTRTVASGFDISHYVIVKHRNHVPIMSAATVSLPNNGSPYDFTTAQTQAYGGGTPMADLSGAFGLYSGDGNASYGVTATDRNAVWRVQNGTSGYLSGDFNLSNGVTAVDRNGHWRVNNGKGTLIPNP